MSVPGLVGTVRGVVGTVSGVVGTVSGVVGTVPGVVGAVPVVVGAVSPVGDGLPGLGLPGLVRTVPRVVAEVAEVTDVRHGGTPSLRMFVPPPVAPVGRGPHVALAPPLGQVDGGAPSVPAEPPPGPVASFTQSPPADAGEPTGGGRATARVTPRGNPSGPPSTPHSPFDTGAGTNRPGPAPSGGGQAVTLPATVGWQPPKRSSSVAPYDDVSPVGRTPGVPALPG